MNLKNWKNKAAIANIFGSILFIVLIFIAMIFYSGGNYDNPYFLGYSFWKNLISDMGRAFAYSGRPNTVSMIIFSIGIVLYALSLIPCSLVFPHLFQNGEKERKRAKLGSIFGLIAFISMIGVVFAPIDLFYTPHGILAIIIYISLFFNAIYYSLVLYKNKKFPKICKIIFLTYLIIFFIALFIGLMALIIDIILLFIAQKLIHIASIISFIFLDFGVWKIDLSQIN